MLTDDQSRNIQDIANTVRGLSMDAIEAANSGHPGLPLGCAEIGAYLYGHALRHNPKDPNWINRDRFILSAGHGSMLLYALLHLSGFDLSLAQVKAFRQYQSPTAGHPEYGHIPGIETTTGPLGQGLATAIGIALAHKAAAARYKADELLDARTYVLAGDGCLMEGISAEASSLAGHLKLDNLVLIYDANKICLDGPISDCFTENVAQRYKAYDWEVLDIDGHDIQALHSAIEQSRSHKAPTLIIANTIIGKGAPTVAGSSEAHGKAMGAEEVAATKQYWGIPQEPFHVPATVTEFLAEQAEQGAKAQADWQARYQDWRDAHPELATLWETAEQKRLTEDLDQRITDIEIKDNVASRQSSNAILQHLQDLVPELLGGSADLSCSDSTAMKEAGWLSPEHFEGRNIKYGVREFAMAAMATGLSLHGLHRPYCGTFLMFSDYMRNAIRLAALMNVPVIYQFTHDSIFLGEDGPTHQPVEHLASLRAIPNLTVIRPADNTETKAAWIQALRSQNPVALILSRQGLPSLEQSSIDGARRGAYILKKAEAATHLIMASGSECHKALAVAEALEEKGASVQVVSIPSFELFNQQDKSYQDQVLTEAAVRVAIEAQTSFGWHQYIGRDGIAITVDRFGQSAPAKDLETEYGFSIDQILERIPL